MNTTQRGDTRRRTGTSQPALVLLSAVLLLGLTACDSGGGGSSEAGPSQPSDAGCILPINQFADGGVGWDVIAALTNPPLVGPAEASYLGEQDRVIGLVIGDQPVALPHNIFWFHEVANLDFAGAELAVTYCPLTGSSMVFDRGVIGGREFGVSGLLFQNNLTMFDRTTGESLWPQMFRRAACGPRLGATLEMTPVLEVTWAGWKALHPDTRVLSADTGYGLLYTAASYPYGGYETPDNDALLFPMALDDRRLPKERVLGVPNSRQGGIAFPFEELDDGAPANAVHTTTADGIQLVVFWHRAYQSAMAYRPSLDGERLTFEILDGRIVDTETQSTWRLDGIATDGPLAGARLEPIAEAYVAFWFAWAAFHPATQIWNGS